MRRQKMVIGLIGKPWSGKDTLAQVIKEIAPKNKKVVIIRFSDILNKTLKSWYIPTEPRENRRKLAQFMNEAFVQYGGRFKSVLANIAKQKILKSRADIFIINNLKSPCDVAMVREFPCNLIIYITASFNLRYIRRQLSKGEPVEINGRSYDKFALEDLDQGELFISQIGQESDIIIENDGTMEEFVKKVKEIYQEKIAPLIS
jgi:dephospho-CoA kinase